MLLGFLSHLLVHHHLSIWHYLKLLGFLICVIGSTRRIRHVQQIKVKRVYSKCYVAFRDMLQETAELKSLTQWANQGRVVLLGLWTHDRITCNTKPQALRRNNLHTDSFSVTAFYRYNSTTLQTSGFQQHEVDDVWIRPFPTHDGPHGQPKLVSLYFYSPSHSSSSSLSNFSPHYELIEGF